MRMNKRLLTTATIGLSSWFFVTMVLAQQNLTEQIQRKTNDVGKTVNEMAVQADGLMAHVKSEIAKSFLAAAKHLPPIETYDLYYKVPGKSNGSVLGGVCGISFESWSGLSQAEQHAFTRMSVSEKDYYFTRHGSPIMFVRALDLVGQAGLDSLDGKKLVDFGFGSIGHLRILASNGSDVTGIEVNQSLRGIYSRDSDTGAIPKVALDTPNAARNVGKSKTEGSLKLLFGRFPVDPSIAEKTGTGIDVFFSKNTLKRGYIHPAQKVDPRKMIDLGVSDSKYIRSVYDRLNPGGFFMIYNLHPQRTEPGKNYITWSDGRSPFSKKDLEEAGFQIIQFDCDDTPAAHLIATKFGWDKQMNLEKKFRATYTLIRK